VSYTYTIINNFEMKTTVFESTIIENKLFSQA
jgi:hypothetical protein